MKSTKKFIAIMLTLVFVLSMVLPMGVLADATEGTHKTIKFTKSAISVTRGGKATDTYPYKNHSSSQFRTYATTNTSSNCYITYVKFDLSTYEREVLSASSAALSLKGSNSKTSGATYTMTILSGGNEDWLPSELTANSAAQWGINDESGLFSLTQSYTGTSNDAQIITSDGMVDAIQQALLNDGGNSTIVIRFKGTGSDLLIKAPTIELSFLYNTQEIADNNTYLASIKNSLTWNVLSSESINMVTQNLYLPKKLFGADVAWTSSKPDVIRASSGEVVVQNNAAIPVTLTAELSYTNATGESADPTAPIVFSVVVRDPASMVKDKIIPLVNVTHSRDQNGETPMNISEYDGNKYIQFRQGGQSNTRYGYGQFDLSGYEEILENSGTELKTVFKAYGGTYVMKDFQVFIMNDSVDDYVASDLSYNLAEKMGMHEFENGTLLYYRSDATSATSLESSVNRIDVVDKLKTGTDNSLVTLVFDSLSNNTSRIFYEYADNGLYITYDKSEINNAEYLKEVKDALTWDVLSKGDQDKVSADLYLPTKFKGAKIVWESDNAAITADGKVDFENNKGKTVKLTAKMTYTNILGQSAEDEKEFVVTISDGKYYEIGTPELKIEDNKFKASWGVENYTGEDVTYYVYLAAYSNKELVGLKPIEYVAKNGEPTFINPEVKFQEGYTAKLIVLKSDHITPLFAATEK